MAAVDCDYRDLLPTRHEYRKVYADTIGKNVEVQLLFVSILKSLISHGALCLLKPY